MYTNLRLTALAAALACAAAPAGAEDLMQIYTQARQADTKAEEEGDHGGQESRKQDD